jgi:hypothetical protein
MPRVISLRVLYPAGILAMALALPNVASGEQVQFSSGGSEARGGDTGTSIAATGTSGPAGKAGDDLLEQARGPAEARLLLRTEGDSGGTVHVGDNVKLIGRLRPFVPDQKVKLRYSKRGKIIKQVAKKVNRIGNTNVGKVKMTTKRIIRPGKYRAAAVKESSPAQGGDKARSPRFRPVYPDLDPGQNNRDVRLFNSLLKHKKYYVSTGSGYGDPTERAVMAFRKVNNMSRSYNASPQIFRTLADGKGGFNLNRPGAGRHVEVDISRQVMVLADHGKAQHIFHVSTGAPSTPSDRGSYRFYRRQPGYNSIGMYYSVYYNRGEATHGYESVPPYPASHGCIRIPMFASNRLPGMIPMGTPVLVYGCQGEVASMP